MLQRIGHRYLSLIVLAVIVAALPLLFPSSYYFRVASLVWVSALAAIGLNVLMGQAGQVSLGHAGFFGIGAYAVAIGPAHFGIPPWAALPLGCVISGVLAYLVGRPILKLRGHYLAIATLGVMAALHEHERLIGRPTRRPLWLAEPDALIWTLLPFAVIGWWEAGLAAQAIFALASLLAVQRLTARQS